MKDTFTPETLIPNICDLSETTSIVELAGYFEDRDYIGVVAVSYFLRAVMKRAKSIKFLLVIDEAVLIDRTGEGIIKSFQEFINIFKFNEMDEALKASLK